MANKITSAVSILIYLVTLILSIIEITKAKILYDATCSEWSCWAIFIVVWALAIPVSALSIAREIAVLALTTRRSRRRGAGADLAKPTTVRSRAALWSAVAVWALWLAVLVIGWAPIRFSRALTQDDFVAQDNGNFAGGLDYTGPAPDVTGMFLYVRSLYEAVMPYYEDGLGTSDLFVFVRAGYGAAIMATLSFAWSFLNIIFEFASQHGPRGQLVRSKV